MIVAQLVSRVSLVTPWTAAHQTSLSLIISRSLLKFMSIELVMLSNHSHWEDSMDTRIAGYSPWGCKELDTTERLTLSLGQFSSVAQSCPTLCDPTDCSTPGLPVHHQLLE